MTQPSPEDSPDRSGTPTRLYMLVDGLTPWHAVTLAGQAVRYAQQIAPKMSGKMSADLQPYWGSGFFGIRFPDAYTWYQEKGTRPRLMRELAGRTIPMWIDDPTGSVRRENPKSDVRITASGKTQVKIFRKVASVGQRKNVRRRVGGQHQNVSVPASYPGAPGRIASRSHPNFPSGPSSGRVASGNVGVRWFNPGIHGKEFMHHSLRLTAQLAGLGTPEIHAR